MQNNPMNNPDIVSLLNAVQQRLASLERKLDILVSRGSQTKAPESKPLPAPIQKPAQVNQGNIQRHDNHNNNRDRLMYGAICADCKKDCEVPFKPSGDRPVYCRECFAKRKANHSLKTGMESKPKEMPPVPVIPIDEKQASGKEAAVAKKEPFKKKKTVAKKKAAAGKSAATKTKASKKPKKKNK